MININKSKPKYIQWGSQRTNDEILVLEYEEFYTILKRKINDKSWCSYDHLNKE